MDWLFRLNESLNSLVWGPLMMILLIGSGVLLTVVTKGVQFRRFGFAVRQVLQGGRSLRGEGTISPFEALATSLSATVGVGNIAGVSIAIATGGPGAVFWMVVSGVVGMATKFAEIAIAIEYRQKQGGTPMRGGAKWVRNKFVRVDLSEGGVMRGGAMYVLAERFGMKWLGSLFATFCAFAAFGIGNMTQANTVVTGLADSYGIPPWLSGAVLATLTALVVVGGIRRIAAVVSILVPAMCGLYMACALAVLFTNLDAMGSVLGQILGSAFTGHAAMGGFAGATVRGMMQTGVARGLFSNEAGMGSSPIVHAAAVTDHPVRQASYGIFGVFVDTIVVCNLTAFSVLATGVWTSGSTGAVLIGEAFSKGLPGEWGGQVVTLVICLFGFSTIIGWAFYGETGFIYLFGAGTTMPYRAAWVGAVLVGSFGGLEAVWRISDTMNALMAVLNLVAVIGSIGVLRRLMRDFFNDRG